MSERNWKENIRPRTAAYGTVHDWVRYHFGSAYKCEGENCENRSQTFHWSNISGRYKRERDDWQQLCVSCHKNFDNDRRRKLGIPVKALKTHCKRGHRLSGDNIRIRKNDKYTWHYCYPCKLIRNKSRDRRKTPLIERRLYGQPT